MNEELLNTPAVKSSIKRYLEMGLRFEDIKERLIDIHLIIVDDDKLHDFIDNLKELIKKGNF